MKNENNKKNKGTYFIAILTFLIIIFLPKLLTNDDRRVGLIAIIFAAVIIVFIGYGIYMHLRQKNHEGSSAQRNEEIENLMGKFVNAGRDSFAQRKDQFSHYMNKDIPKEEAITCQCKHGREKYLSEVDEWYKNGLINKEEYALLKKRYSEVEIPEGIVD